MSSVKVFQGAFNAGEIAPELIGRVDDAKYSQGLATCQNFICLPQGPVQNRAGTEFVRVVKDSSKPVRTITFNRGENESMCLEFGHKYIRFHINGMTLLNSSGTPYEVTTPYEAEDIFDLHYAQSIDVVTIVHPRYQPMDLKRYGATDWRLEAVKLNNVLSAPTGVSVTYHCMDEDGTIKNKTAFTLSYVVTACDANGDHESEASSIASTSGNLYITSAYAHVSWTAVSGAKLYKVYKSVGGLFGYIGQTTNTYIDDDNIRPDMDFTPKYLDDAFGMVKAITSVSVTNQGSGYLGTRGIQSYEGTGQMDAGSGWETFILGQGTVPPNIISRLQCEVKDEGGTGTGAVATLKYHYIGSGYSQMGVVDGFDIVKAGSGFTNPYIYVYYYQSNGGARVDYIKVKATLQPNDTGLKVTDSTGSGAVLLPVVSSDGKITGVTIISGGSGYTSPTITVTNSSGSGATFNASVGSGSSYPVSVTRFEQRRLFAGSYQLPQHIWMTRNGTEDDLSYCLPLRDDDRISVDMATTDGGEIRHIVATTQLLILTDGGEYRVSPINSDAITPTSMNIRPQSFVGANNVQPLLVNNNVLYAAARGGHIREMGYSYSAGGYVTGDICLRSMHLFDHYNIVDLAYQKAPYPTIWAVSSSGELLGATYIPEQQVLGWHRHTTEGGTFESVCAVPEGNIDAIYVVVRRLINGSYYRMIERIGDRNFRSLEEAFLVDCGITIDKRGTDETITEVSGLGHLEGCTVSILGDGAVFPQQVVANGKITLPQAVSIVHVGLPIEAKLRTLPLVVGTRDSTAGRGRNKRVNKVYLRVISSSGIWAGPADGTLVESKSRSTEPAGTPPRLRSTEIGIVIPPSINSEGQVDIEQFDPLPLELVSITADVDLMS